jgi:hypothetical protein
MAEPESNDESIDASNARSGGVALLERDTEHTTSPAGTAGEPVDVESVEAERVRDRLLIPLLLPLLCVAAIALYTLNISRVFLAGDSTSALVIASLVTVSILVGAGLVSAIPRLRASSLAMFMGLVLLVVVSAGLLALGPSLESGGTDGPRPQPRGAPVATVAVEASAAGPRFNASNYDAPAGIVEFNLTGATGHTLQFRELDYAGFPLSTSGGPAKGKVRLEPGTYNIYCTITGHAATMHATITVNMQP